MWEYGYGDELYHHGVKGQKWGVRRFQNYDGSWVSPEAAQRFRRERSKEVYRTNKRLNKVQNKADRLSNQIKKRKASGKSVSKQEMALKAKKSVANTLTKYRDKVAKGLTKQELANGQRWVKTEAAVRVAAWTMAPWPVTVGAEAYYIKGKKAVREEYG